MQLGNILRTATDPVVARPITFRVLGTDSAGKQTSAQAEAVLAFVPESLREEHKQRAREYLENGDYKGKQIPIDVLIEEEYRWFVLAVLRDKDDPSRPFCPASEYPTFRSAIIMEQVAWLREQYRAFVKDEYPELATKEQQDALVGAAAGE